jgi:L-asparaginase II
MPDSAYLPILELTRGRTVESIHSGAVAVVSAQGELVASFGDHQVTTYLRSSAKPFQALPFLEHNGKTHFNLTLQEIALMCASHAGTDEHIAVLKGIQEKAGLSESDLKCGVHPSFDPATTKVLQQRGEQPTPNRHNCSGKHTGMLSFAKMFDLPLGDYLDPDHPIQQEILQTFAETCALPQDEISLGTDGCSAPIFAIPLYNAALAYARLCDPVGGKVVPEPRLQACYTIRQAMTTYPLMVSGSGHFDTTLMEITQGRVLSKGGAEGYQGIGLLPGALGTGSPGLGIALKIADGDPKTRARSAVSIEVLRQLGALSKDELQALARFGPGYPLYNWRKLEVGEARPCFELELNG